MHIKLTTDDARALELTPGKSEDFVWDAELPRFGVRLRRGRAGVRRTYIYQYQIGRRTRRFTIGNVVAMVASAARKTAGDLHAEVRLGRDPQAAKAAGRRQTEMTFGGDILADYLQEKKGKLRRNSFGNTKRNLEKAFRSLHTKPLVEITTPMVSAELSKIAVTRGVTASIRAHQSVSTYFRWLMRQGHISSNPAANIERRRAPARDHVLNATEIGAVWRATSDTNAAGAVGEYATIIRLLMLTGCRLREIGGLRWSEIFSDRIVLSPERVKNNQRHTIPITSTIRAILDARPRISGRDCVFGSHSPHGFTGWDSKKQLLDKNIQLAGTVMRPWRTHDLRRTYTTGLYELEFPPHLVEASINHAGAAKRGVAGIYNRSRLEQPIYDAMLAWEKHVVAAAEGRGVRSRGAHASARLR